MGTGVGEGMERGDGRVETLCYELRTGETQDGIDGWCACQR